MDGHFGPSPTQYNPANPFGDGGDESFNRATMPPPSGSSLAPHQIQPPPQYGSQNFIPGASPMLSQHPPSSSGVNKDTTYPPIPFAMLKSSWGSSLPLAHKRASSEIIVSGLNSMFAQNNHIHPMPIEMAVGVRSQQENVGEDSSVNRGNKGPANEIAPPSRRSISFDSSLKGKSSVEDEDTPPQGVSVDGLVFTASQLAKISANDKLKNLAERDPKRVKRILSNRKSAARSKERKEELFLSYKLKVDRLTAQLNLEKRGKRAADEECKRLRQCLERCEEQARFRDGLNELLTGEVHRLREVVSRLSEELSEYRMREMNANMLEQLNINPQTNYNF